MMIYFCITAGVFLLDFFLKRYMDKHYRIGERHLYFGGKVCVEKYYNTGAALNFLAKYPERTKKIHAYVMAAVGGAYAAVLHMRGQKVCKTGLAMLVGGGLGNLYDRYKKGHVVDYVRFGVGPKRFRKIIFNAADFFIFLGAVFVVLGGLKNDKRAV